MRIELSPQILVYTGRSRGREDRKAFKLDSLDAHEGQVEIVVPPGIYSMTSSYFLELLGKSIRQLGEEQFRSKYRIIGPVHVTRKVDDWIARALRENKGLLGRGID